MLDGWSGELNPSFGGPPALLMTLVLEKYWRRMRYDSPAIARGAHNSPDASPLLEHHGRVPREQRPPPCHPEAAVPMYTGPLSSARRRFRL